MPKQLSEKPTLKNVRLIRIQEELEEFDLFDVHQIDTGEQEPIMPDPEGLGADIRREWQAAVDEAVSQQLHKREEAIKAEMQVYFALISSFEHHVVSVLSAVQRDRTEQWHVSHPRLSSQIFDKLWRCIL
jgi:hypothetical protein